MGRNGWTASALDVVHPEGKGKEGQEYVLDAQTSSTWLVIAYKVSNHALKL